MPSDPATSPPNAPAMRDARAVGSHDVFERVARVLKLIRPAVQADGGDVELVDVTPQGEVHIRLHGACVGCPSSMITLSTGIERNLKAHIPEVRAVRAVD